MDFLVENLNIKANFIYVVQKEHREKYNLDALLSLITPGCKVVETEGKMVVILKCIRTYYI